MLRLVAKQQMKRDASLYRVEFLDVSRDNIANLANWCEATHILNDRLKYTMFNAEITVVCTEEQLTLLLLKFGGSGD